MKVNKELCPWCGNVRSLVYCVDFDNPTWICHKCYAEEERQSDYRLLSQEE